MDSLPQTVLEDLRQALDANARTMELMLQYMQKQQSPWCDGDEAAIILGVPHSPSGRHRRMVSYLAKKGFI